MSVSNDTLLVHLAEHHRLSALRALAQIPHDEALRRDLLRVVTRIPGGTGNVSLCQSILDDLGYHLSRDRLAGVTAWLDEQGLLLSHRQDRTDVLTITERGEDVAAGRVTVPGVAPQTTLAWLRDNIGRYGLIVGADDMRDLVRWLLDARLITGDDGGPLILTTSGADVAAGAVVHPGVKKPSGGAIMRAAVQAARTRLEE